jgi:hypothetical protein
MRYYCFIFFSVLAFYSKAQDTTLSFNKKYVSKNNVSVELGGIGFIYSINYERNFGIQDNSFNTLRVGSAYGGSLGLTGMNLVYLPVAYTYSIGKKKSKFFVGMGLNLMISPFPYPTTFSGRQYVRHHPTQNYYGEQPFPDTYQPLLNTMLCPMVGYEFISKKAFYFKGCINGIILSDGLIHWLAIPWAGFTFGYKLNR